MKRGTEEVRNGGDPAAYADEAVGRIEVNGAGADQTDRKGDGETEPCVPDNTDKTVVTIEGRVEHGRRLGRKLGFPTANLAVPEDILAEDGVYASTAVVEGVQYRAMSNLGCNPSVGGSERRLETHIFGFSGSLYGCRLRVCLLRKIRDERKFATVAELRAQIERDKERILGQK